MKLFYTIFSLLVCLTLFGQAKPTQIQNPYRKAPELHLVNPVDSSYLVATYKVDAGM
jgi:hypothetical protein